MILHADVDVYVLCVCIVGHDYTTYLSISVWSYLPIYLSIYLSVLLQRKTTLLMYKHHNFLLFFSFCYPKCTYMLSERVWENWKRLSLHTHKSRQNESSINCFLFVLSESKSSQVYMIFRTPAQIIAVTPPIYTLHADTTLLACHPQNACEPPTYAIYAASLLWDLRHSYFRQLVDFLLCHPCNLRGISKGSESQYPTYHHHHQVVQPARISLTVSRHFSLLFITSSRSSGLHPVFSHSCCMYV